MDPHYGNNDPRILQIDRRRQQQQQQQQNAAYPPIAAPPPEAGRREADDRGMRARHPAAGDDGSPERPDPKKQQTAVVAERKKLGIPDLSKFKIKRDPAAWLAEAVMAKSAHLGEVRDGAWTTVTLLVKLFRVMVWWVALYVVDRVYQEWYLQRAYVEGGDGENQPLFESGYVGKRVLDGPPLWSIVWAVVSIEVCAMLLLVCVMLVLAGWFKTDSNTFVIDGKLIACVVVDYAASTVVLVALGMGLGFVAQNPAMFRYGDDGLRAIRAVSVTLLIVAAVVIPATSVG